MIGKAYVSTFKFYDNRIHRMSFKKRPVLIVGKSDETDYVVLPISRVTNRDNLDEYYDVLIDPIEVPMMNLSQCSYVRTHKQTVVHIVELDREIVDFREQYSEIYLNIVARLEEFQKSMIDNALIE